VLVTDVLVTQVVDLEAAFALATLAAKALAHDHLVAPTAPLT
jgi:hypothetical protein